MREREYLNDQKNCLQEKNHSHTLHSWDSPGKAKGEGPGYCNEREKNSPTKKSRLKAEQRAIEGTEEEK